MAIFPGNISQYVNGIDAFGLDSDTARLVRLFFQPLLVVWALCLPDVPVQCRPVRVGEDGLGQANVVGETTTLLSITLHYQC